MRLAQTAIVIAATVAALLHARGIVEGFLVAMVAQTWATARSVTLGSSDDEGLAWALGWVVAPVAWAGFAYVIWRTLTA